jgi:hypothetical protein
MQTPDAPVIGEGVVPTVIGLTAKQPVGSVYEMTVTPPVTPVTMPVDEPTPAMPEMLERHVPPPVISESVVVSPEQTIEAPVIAAGKGFIVTVVAVLQPVGSIYDMIAVPAETPVTMPEILPTTAMPVDAELHRPPEVASVSVVVRPVQIAVVPAMATGGVLTVRLAVV